MHSMSWSAQRIRTVRTESDGDELDTEIRVNRVNIVTSEAQREGK